MIGIVDYGTSNIGSLTNALKKLGITYRVSGDPVELGQCDRLILPGVGAFGHAMEQLNRRDLVPFLKAGAAAGQPIFGICLGMQLLMEQSEEYGEHSGLGLIEGDVRALVGGRRKVHMGWNSVSATAQGSFLNADDFAYFVHSYQCQPSRRETVAAVTEYGENIVAAICQGAIWGVQFHPEKSGDYGLAILKRFADESF